ncbi:uncharacterized protein LOC142981835 isoform X2 [Anticarsia gemmatalis]|uniref:uncharacterized protein LOC142981835 isoform X2 n=1 Tax=Anticarsia gemmatalis TaxID=129554 RepID=UPI003F775EC4
MAPPPEYDKEPKAPDKSATNISTEDSRLLHNLVNDQHTNSDHKPTNTVTGVEVENNKHVETLDDGQLKALLDEAINYKNPKDREGKSSLFQELLEEVEQESDEQACEAAARALSGCRSTRRGARRGPPLPHSNSLQDLVAALAAEPPRKHHVRHAPPPHAPAASVSARAIYGGSLPSGVDTSSMNEEPARGAGYLATVRCVNPPPLAERRVSASDANTPAEMELLNRSKPMFPMTYTARATLEIGSGSVCSGRAVTTTTASNQVDSAISFSCITTPEVVASCNTTSSTSQSAVAVDPKPLQLGSCYRAVASITGGAAPGAAALPGACTLSAPGPALGSPAQPRSVISSSFNGLPLSRPNYGSTGTSATDDYKVLVAYKSLDENGNSVQGFSSPLSGSSQHKKPRRKKSSKNETVIDCQQIDGYQGDKDVNELLRFIESNADNGRGAKLPRVKHKDDSDDKGGKKRSTERRKDKEPKIKRASSLEELSRTKIEDLTDVPEAPLRPDKKERRDHAPAKAERRSWGDDAREPFEPATDPVGPAPQELTDFQTVTKKRKPRRRADDPERDPPRRARPPSPRARRESAPPSDRSNDSNDDMDSVHSLPDAPRAAPAPPAPAAPPAPHASYAEIARTRHNIPDLIESCNFYAEGEGPPRREPAGAPGDADGYPALEARAAAARRRDAKPPPPAARRKERPAPPGDAPRAPDCPAPDVVADRRPPVILLDSEVRPRDMDGVTFGFDINEQLLGGPARRPRCDLVRDAVAGVAAGVAVRAGCAALRYVPPDPPPDTLHLHQIVDYVGAAWEDVVRCGGGKVRYFSE